MQVYLPMIASHYHRYIFSVAESYRQKTDTSELIVKSKHKSEKETRTTHAYQHFFFHFLGRDRNYLQKPLKRKVVRNG